MESAYILWVLLALFVVFVLPVWAMISVSAAKSRVELLGRGQAARHPFNHI